MAGACIGIYRKERLDESYREILRKYQKQIIEDTCWFSIELEYHLKPEYTDYETNQLIEVFGCFPEQVIWIFGDEDRIFVAAFEIIKHLGGLLDIDIGDNRVRINSFPGTKIEVHKIQHKNPSKHRPAYWLVDHLFVREFFKKVSGDNFERFKLDKFSYQA